MLLTQKYINLTMRDFVSTFYIPKEVIFFIFSQKLSKNKTKTKNKTASVMPLGRQQNLILSPMSRLQKDMKEMCCVKKNPTL